MACEQQAFIGSPCLSEVIKADTLTNGDLRDKWWSKRTTLENWL